MADEVLDEANFKAKIREVDPTVRYLYVPGARDTEIWLQGFPQHLRECYIDKKSLVAVRTATDKPCVPPSLSFGR